MTLSVARSSVRSVAVLTAGLGIAVGAALACAPRGPMPSTVVRAARAAESSEPVGLKVGEAAPDSEFVDNNGKALKVSELRGKGPLVVVFYRGGWCPFCTKSLAAWQGRLADLEAAGGTLVAVSLEKPSLATAVREKHKLTYRVLADPSGDACRAFKVLFEVDGATREKYAGYGIDLEKSNANGKWVLPVPATYVLDQGGTVRWSHFDADYKKRAAPDDVIAAVKAAK